MHPSLQRLCVIALIVFGAWLVGFFGMQTVQAFKEVRSHKPPPPFKAVKEEPETDVQLIEDWMTIPFIGKMYHVSPVVIFKALNIPMEKNREKNLRQLNDEYYPGVKGYVETQVKAVVLENLPPPVNLTPTVPAGNIP